MTDVRFSQITDEPASDNPGPDDSGCQCSPDDNQFLLEIEEGQAVLIHTACGKQPPANWGDWHDLVSMGPIPVTVGWERECDGSEWHGEHRCDCDSYLVVDATSVPDNVRAAALALSHQHAVNRAAS